MIYSKEIEFTKWQIKIDKLNVNLYPKMASSHSFVKEGFLNIDADSVFIANQQTAGHGRFNRAWISPSNKNIYLTLFLKPNLEVIKFSHLTQICAISIAQVVKDVLCLDLQLKWPNDLLYDKHKLCGILAEMVKKNDENHIILSFGLNVNSIPKDFINLDRKATSLSICTQQNINREELITLIIKQLFINISKLNHAGIIPFIKHWKSMDNFIGTKAKLIYPDRDITINGQILEINNDGTLKFKTSDDEIINVFSADLEV